MFYTKWVLIFLGKRLQDFPLSMSSSDRTGFKSSNYGQLGFAFIGKVFSVVIV